MFREYTLASVKLHVRVGEAFNLPFESVALTHCLNQLRGGIITLYPNMIESRK